MRRWSTISGIRISLVAVLIVTTFASLLPQVAEAASVMKSTVVRFDSMDTSDFTSGTVCVEAFTGTNADYVQVTFPAGFTVSGTLGNWTTSLTQPSGPGSGSLYWPSGAIAFPNALTATNVTGQTVTWQFTTAAALSTTGYNCFNWTNTTTALKNPTSVGSSLEGSVDTENTTPAVMDSGNFATAVISNDQIVVTATVPPIFIFTMPSNTDTFTANLSPTGTTATSGVTPTIQTNAKGGWVMWVEDSNQALSSASTSGSIPSVGWNTNRPTSFTVGTAQYGLSVIAEAAGGTACTITVDPEYDTTTYGGTGGEFWGHWQQAGQCAGGESNGDGLKFVEEAGVSVLTPAATDYTDTLTIVGAGLF